MEHAVDSFPDDWWSPRLSRRFSGVHVFILVTFLQHRRAGRIRCSSYYPSRHLLYPSTCTKAGLYCFDCLYSLSLFVPVLDHPDFLFLLASPRRLRHTQAENSCIHTCRWKHSTQFVILPGPGSRGGHCFFWGARERGSPDSPSVRLSLRLATFPSPVTSVSRACPLTGLCCATSSAKARRSLHRASKPTHLRLCIVRFGG
jgi:hypothetical protein